MFFQVFSLSIHPFKWIIPDTSSETLTYEAELSLKNKMSFLFKEKLKKNPTHDRDLDQESPASCRAFTPVDDSFEFVDDTPPTVPTGNSIQQSP